jgi:hypothetical protein
MNKNIVLIDADSLCFLGKKDDTVQQIIEKVDFKIQSILLATDADYYCLFISKGKYFRHALKDKSEESGSYKSNRKYSNQNYNRVIKEYLIAQYNASSSPLMEADDLINYWMNKFIFFNGEYLEVSKFNNDGSSNINKIMVAVDKDLLQGIAGLHLNYNKKLGEDEWGMELVHTTKDEAIEFFWNQMIMGDSSDGIKGIPGKGIKYAEKVYSDEGRTYEDICLDEYMKYYGTSQGIYEFQKNYRLLHLLETDEDCLREVGYLPELPNFLEVDKSKSIEITF